MFAGRPQEGARAQGRPERRRVGGRLRPQRHRPADDRPRRPGSRRSCSRCSRFIFALQHLGDHPGRADAGERPHGDCRCSWPSLVWVIYNVVGIAHAGPVRLLQERSCSRPACRWPLYVLVAPIEFVSGPDRAAPLAGRPTLRQHARRPPPAGRPSPCSPRRSASAHPCSSCILPFSLRPAGRPDRLRGAGVRSCRPSSSRSSPPCTSAAPCTPSTDRAETATDLT